MKIDTSTTAGKIAGMRQQSATTGQSLEDLISHAYLDNVYQINDRIATLDEKLDTIMLLLRKGEE